MLTIVQLVVSLVIIGLLLLTFAVQVIAMLAESESESEPAEDLLGAQTECPAERT